MSELSDCETECKTASAALTVGHLNTRYNECLKRGAPLSGGSLGASQINIKKRECVSWGHMLEGANEVCVKGYACVTIRCREDGAVEHILTCL